MKCAEGESDDVVDGTSAEHWARNPGEEFSGKRAEDFLSARIDPPQPFADLLDQGAVRMGVRGDAGR